MAQMLKVLIYWAIERKFNWRRFFGSGGMPSSHTALVVTVAVMIGSTEGFHTSQFAIAFTLMIIVMYDAAGVRRETGTQAKVINRIIRNIFIDGNPVSDDELKELVGHTPLEVFAGVIVGLLVSLFFLA
ncbi:MAG: divergent PAP2 family protein [Clostridiales bacterium]|nr:divergent PAP2 family protein [Clostridiales bacterium]